MSIIIIFSRQHENISELRFKNVRCENRESLLIMMMKTQVTKFICTSIFECDKKFLIERGLDMAALISIIRK